MRISRWIKTVLPELAAWNWKLVREIRSRTEAETALVKGEEKFRLVFESANVGKSITLPTGEVNVNQTLCDMLGYTRDELKGKKWQDITPPDEIEATQKLLDPLLHGKKDSIRFSKRYIHKNGSYIDADVSTVVHRDSERKPLFFITTVIDISERKGAENKLRESERKLREVQEMAHLGSWHWDVKTGDVEWSEEVYKIFRLDPETFTPHIDSILALSPWPEDHQRDKELINRAIETHSPGFYEQKFLRPDKSIGYYYSTFHGNYDVQAKLVSIVGTVMDITERKRVEEELRESEQRIRTFLDSTSDMAFLKDESFRHIIANSSLCKFYGKTENEIIGKTDFDLMTGKAASECKKTDEQTLLSNALLITEEVVGGRYYETMKFPVELAEGKKGIGAYIRDITERKRADETLRESEIELRAILESTGDGILVVDNNGKVIKTNKRFADLWLIPQSLLNSGDDEALLTYVLGQLIEPAQFIDKVHKLYGSTEEDLDILFFKDGRIFERFSTTFLLNDSNIGRVWSFRDVTDRKRAEEAKKRSRDLIVETQRIAKLGGWEYDTATRRVTWTDEVYHIYGVSSDYDPSCPENDIQFYAPEDQKKIADAFQRAVEVGEPYDLELQLINAHGEKLWIRTVGQVEHKEGKINRVFGNIMDITERKRAEDALRESNRQWQSTFDATDSAIWILDLEQRVLRSNKTAEKFFHRPYGEFIGKYCWEIVHGTTEPIPECPILRARKSLHRETMELKIGEGWFEVTVDPILDADGHYTGAVHTVCNITDRKCGEEEIRKLNEDLEKRINERTTELRETITRLEEVNRTFVGRELRMMELKERIAELENK
jgi:PAS domain S-box-containing protein